MHKPWIREGRLPWSANREIGTFNLQNSSVSVHSLHFMVYARPWSVGACLATGDRTFPTGNGSVSKFVLRPCGCFCLISGHAIMDWNPGRNYIHPPPPFPPFIGKNAFFRGGGWGCIFWAPTRPEFYTPPTITHPPPLERYFQQNCTVEGRRTLPGVPGGPLALQSPNSGVGGGGQNLGMQSWIERAPKAQHILRE